MRGKIAGHLYLLSTGDTQNREMNTWRFGKRNPSLYEPTDYEITLALNDTPSCASGGNPGSVKSPRWLNDIAPF